MEKLIPYSVYLSPEYYNKIKKYAKKRQASEIVRQGISLAVDGQNMYALGYKQAVKDCLVITKQIEKLEAL